MGMTFVFGVATSSCGSGSLGYGALAESFLGGTSFASYSSCE